MGSVEGEWTDAAAVVVMERRLDFVPRLVKGGDENRRVDE
jgi:hypothetical protein